MKPEAYEELGRLPASLSNTPRSPPIDAPPHSSMTPLIQWPPCVLVLLVLVQVASATDKSWTHGWETAGDAWWGDFGYSLLTDEQARFVASTYKVVSLEKCTGQRSGLKSENAIYKTAAQLKAINPGIKVIFYWSVTQAGTQ